jgi:N6-L-threonylcarbamoyladenine synthase
LLLLVSGGHCQILLVEGVGKYRRLGTTIDDAIGEAFDKTAKMLDLGYPGGPAIEKIAADGDPNAVRLPRPMKGRNGCDFSFAGLKTAVLHVLKKEPNIPPADLAASFQAAVVDVMRDRLQNALNWAALEVPDLHHIVVAGGVAANGALRAGLEEAAGAAGLQMLAPPIELCTDNAAMIAWAGLERFRLGLTDDLGAEARPRWPLDPDAAPKPFAGVRA